MEMPLEDQVRDILVKAAAGKGRDLSLLLEECGVTSEAWDNLEYEPESVVSALAPPLDLHREGLLLVAHNLYPLPEEPLPEEVVRFVASYGDFFVNSWLIVDPLSQKAWAFDTGGDATPLLSYLKKHGLALEKVFITHTHSDHFFDLERLLEKTGAQAYVNRLEACEPAISFDAGEVFECGPYQISTRHTPGHSLGMTTFVVQGLSCPVAVVGDTLYAGSVGRPNVSLAMTLESIRREILTLSDDTWLCPGHGVPTRVGVERRHNPFLAIHWQ